MSGSIVSKILACVVVVLFCFIIGARAADGAISSLAIIVGLVGAVFMLVMGARSWMLIFLLPPIVAALPLPGALGSYNKTFLVGAVVAVYWLFMWAMGYVKIRWRGLLLLDILAFLSFALMVASYLKKPVSVLALGIESDYIGGAPYVYAIGAFIYYIALSCIPMPVAQLGKVLSWKIWIGLVSAIIICATNLVGYGAEGAESMSMGEAMQETRFGAFSELGKTLVVLLFAYFPLVRFLTNPLLTFGMMMSYAMILISGFRSALVMHTIVVVFMSVMKKEFLLLLLLGIACYGGLLVMSVSGGLSALPYGAQRALSVVPGLQVDTAAARDADGSAEWRYVMWEWALDKRTGFIKDYVWGDGIGLSYSEWSRDQRAMMRGEMRYGDQDQFARSAQWHSIIITTIQSWGYVGLVVVISMAYATALLILRTCSSLRGSPLFVPALVLLMPFTQIVIFLYFNAGNMQGYFSWFVSVANTKLLYCIAREQGLLIPWFQRRRYVPLMIEEHGDRLQQPV